MKKTLIFSLFICFNFANGQSINEGFDNVLSLYSGGWWGINNSNPSNSNYWYQDAGNFTAFSGAANSSVTTGWYCTDNSGTGDASNWFFTPPVNLYNGDTIRFYTISYNNTEYPDRLELRLNTTNTDTLVGTTSTSTGNYSNLQLTINPLLDTINYPMVWTQYEVVISGVPGGPGRIAFRYNVPNTGGSGVNGSVIGIDNFEFIPGPLAVIEKENDFQVEIYPNPVSDFVTINLKNESSASLELISQLGQVIQSMELSSQKNYIDMSSFNQGLYWIRVNSSKGNFTKLLMKR